MAETDIFDFLSDLLTQTDKSVSAVDEPEYETLNANDIVSDSAELASRIFPAGTVRIPAREMANVSTYAAEQAVARIMMMYNSDRSDFYEVGTMNNHVRRERFRHKKAVRDALLAKADAAEKMGGLQ